MKPELSHAFMVAMFIIWSIPALVLAPRLLRALQPRSRKLRKMVFANLDSAAQNGYFEPGEHCHDMSADELAYDMTAYAADLESCHCWQLVPYVIEWKRKRGIA